MNKLTWWFRVTGAVYIALGILWLPFVNARKIDTVVPGFDGPTNGTAYHGFLDYLLMFGLDLLVIGVFLLVAATRTSWHAPLVWLVVALELVRGIFDDLYMIASGYPVGSNVAFIALHAAIIITGVVFLRDTAKSRATTAPLGVSSGS